MHGFRPSPIDDTQLALAAERLRAGGVVAFPTETVYGLGADAFNPEAVARVFTLKGRPAHNPLIVHVTGRDMAQRAARAWPREAELLAHAFWPGPLTLVLPRRDEVPEIVTAGAPSVAVRCPDHPMALALLFAVDRPLVGPSANLSGRVSPTRAQHVQEAFKPADVLVLDGGPCTTGIESTVLSLLDDQPRVLRPGIIGPTEIAKAIGREVLGLESADGPGNGPLLSPGLLASHYAPRARAVVFDPPEWPRVFELAAGAPIALLAHTDGLTVDVHRLIRMPAEALAYAANLYNALREADECGAALIAVERPPRRTGDAHADAVWIAVADRLRRATSGL